MSATGTNQARPHEMHARAGDLKRYDADREATLISGGVRPGRRSRVEDAIERRYAKFGVVPLCNWRTGAATSLARRRRRC